ncbi:MAG: hypothetical protein RBU30_27185 [Polyangia bacterium]|jgi:hypothetical protein|nr:hypothetical protein [Polyangia bacterium]
MSKSGSRNEQRAEPVRLPEFDPKPSARFAVEILTEAGAPYALIGRVAMWSLLPGGNVGFTKDVDFAVPRSAELGILKALAGRGIAPRSLPIGGWAVREPEIRVDFIDRREGGLHTLYEEAIEEAQTAGGRADIGGSTVPVVLPEHLVAMKIVAGEDRDETDAVELLGALPNLDLPRIRAIVAKHGGPGSANRLDALARRAGRPDARPAYRNGD